MKIDIDEVYKQRLEQLEKDLKKELRKGKNKNKAVVIRLINEKQRLLKTVSITQD